jgi:hypothetical protein
MKFTYQAWRPITAIRVGNRCSRVCVHLLGTSHAPPPILTRPPRPHAPHSVGFPADQFFTPLLPTPAHPEYPSGHVASTAAAAEALRLYTGKDEWSITVPSYLEPSKSRSFRSLSAMVKVRAHAPDTPDTYTHGPPHRLHSKTWRPKQSE